MTYEEWWSSYVKPASIYTLKETTEDAWEAGVQEGLRRNREWVGLSEDDIQNILKEWVQTQMTVREMLRETEAKLKQLNT